MVYCSLFLCSVLYCTVPPAINSAPKLSYNYIHSPCGLLDSVGAAFDVDETFFLCLFSSAVLYCTSPPALNDIHSTIMCSERPPIMVFIVYCG